jgi:hypothetical protein
MFRSGWPAIRDGEYGGPLLFFDEDMANFVIVSSLTNFMASNMKRLETGRLAFGLMGSVNGVEAGSSLETVLVGGSDLRSSLELWGSSLATYHGRQQVMGVTEIKDCLGISC